MKLLFHYSAQYFSNTYVIGPDEGGASLIIDPGTLDVPLLEAIEENNLYLINSIKFNLIIFGKENIYT